MEFVGSYLKKVFYSFQLDLNWPERSLIHMWHRYMNIFNNVYSINCNNQAKYAYINTYMPQRTYKSDYPYK